MLCDYGIANLIYWLQTTLWRCALRWYSQMGILAGDARCRIFKRSLKTTKATKQSVQQSGGVVKKWCSVATLCYICEEEAVHCGTVHCIMVWRGSVALWGCAFHSVVKRKWCIVELCMVLAVRRKWCIVELCIALCWEETVHWGTVHCIIVKRKWCTMGLCIVFCCAGKKCALWDCAWCCVIKEGDTAIEVKCVCVGLGLELGQSDLCGLKNSLFSFFLNCK